MHICHFMISLRIFIFYINLYNHITGAFICRITSPSFDAIGVSCELLGNIPRVNITVDCTSCTSSFKSSVLTDGPIIIPNLPSGNYTVDVVVVDSVYINITTTEMIVLSNDITTIMSINGSANESTTGMYVCMYVRVAICIRICICMYGYVQLYSTAQRKLDTCG